MTKSILENLKDPGVNGISEKEYLELKSIEKRLQYLFKKYSVPGEVEDFVQKYREDIASGKRAHQTLDQYTFDYIREKLGRDGQRKDSALVLEHQPWMDKSTSDEHYHSLLEIREEVDQFKGRSRVAVGLILIYGFEIREVAFLLNMTPARVSQFIKTVLNDRKAVWSWKTEEELEAEEWRQKIKDAADILGVPVLWLAEKLREEEKNVQTH
ncbi:MAG: hypothetical protein ACJ76H_14770 [Bacteriovoracaceae bacterium]|jgi:hypothetical protein